MTERQLLRQRLRDLVNGRIQQSDLQDDERIMMHRFINEDSSAEIWQARAVMLGYEIPDTRK